MIVNCKRARLSIALSIGGDLDDDGEWELSAHLEGCEGCRRHLERMRSHLPSLAVASESAELKLHDSVWPDLSRRLPTKRTRRIPRFNGWWVALAVCVACAFLAAVWQNESAGKPAVAQGPSVAADAKVDRSLSRVDNTQPQREVTIDDFYLVSSPDDGVDRVPAFSRRHHVRLPIDIFFLR